MNKTETKNFINYLVNSGHTLNASKTRAYNIKRVEEMLGCSAKELVSNELAMSVTCQFLNKIDQHNREHSLLSNALRLYKSYIYD